ncbi:MAG: YbgF trimerization domain-containing protein [Acinetobacter junii]
MLKKHSAIFIALLSSTHLYANIPIESRALSQQFNDNTTSAPVSTNLNWDLIQKNQKLEEEVRRLRGQLEEHENSIELLKKELANRYTDLDQRLELLSQKIDPPEETTEATTAPKSEPPSPANTIQPDSPKNTTNSTSTPVVQATQNTATTNTTNAQIELEKAAYTVALDAYKQGGAKKAIQPMQNFIKNHPNGIYVGNAYFWLAEFYLAVEPVDYKAAKQNYNIVATRYPNSAKAPRAIYQLYSIAKEVDKNTALANQYKNKLISQYPQTEEAKFIQKK